MADEHEHAYGYVPIDRAPVSGGGHTSFWLLACRCGRAEVFPAENYAQTTPEFQAQLAGRLAAEGCHLEPHEPSP